MIMKRRNKTREGRGAVGLYMQLVRGNFLPYHTLAHSLTLCSQSLLHPHKSWQLHFIVEETDYNISNFPESLLIISDGDEVYFSKKKSRMTERPIPIRKEITSSMFLLCSFLSYWRVSLKKKNERGKPRMGWIISIPSQWLIPSAMSSLYLAGPKGRKLLSLKCWESQKHAISIQVYF